VSAERLSRLGAAGGQLSSARAIGPAGTALRVLAGVLGLSVAVVWQGMGWWDVAAALVAFPLVAVAARGLLDTSDVRRWTSRIRGEGVGYMVSVLAVAGAASLTFVSPADQPAVWAWLGGSLLLAAARGDGACEALAVANAFSGRRERTGCVVFTPLDVAEPARRAARRSPSERL
jgi:hypothetical protein